MRGYGLSLVCAPSPDLLRKSTSPRRGEVNWTRGQADSIKDHLAIAHDGVQLILSLQRCHSLNGASTGPWRDSARYSLRRMMLTTSPEPFSPAGTTCGRDQKDQQATGHLALPHKGRIMCLRFPIGKTRRRDREPGASFRAPCHLLSSVPFQCPCRMLFDLATETRHDKRALSRRQPRIAGRV